MRVILDLNIINLKRFKIRFWITICRFVSVRLVLLAMASSVAASGQREDRELSGKRKYDAVLENKIRPVAPSSFGLTTSDKHSWMSMYREINLKIHRPSADFSGIHVSLMSEVLGQFCEDVNNIKLDCEDNAFTVKFCTAMCGIFTTEEERMAMGNSMLASYLGVTVERLSGNTGGWRNHGATRVTCGSDHGNTVGAIHLEYRNELCSTHTSPGEQALASHLKLIIETPFAMRRSVCPALLFVIAGPHMGVSATVHARGPCVDPVVPLLPLLVLKQLGVHLKRAKCVWRVCKVTMRPLKMPNPPSWR